MRVSKYSLENDMTHAVVGKCPHCGAPIYQPLAWQGKSTPPAVSYSCECRLRTTHVESFWDRKIGPGTIPKHHLDLEHAPAITDQNALDLLTKAMEDDDEFEMTEHESLEERVTKLEQELEKIKKSVGVPKKFLKKKKLNKPKDPLGLLED